MNKKSSERYITVSQGYAPEGKFLWDAWFVKDIKGTTHVFYLQSPRTDEDPEKRHHNGVSIGHATSNDLVNWKEEETALVPGERGEWDDLALWTGSVVADVDGRFHMFYTSRTNTPETYWVQKIGRAYSDDLFHWKKDPHNPLLVADQTHYAYDNTVNEFGRPMAWRDPYIFQDPVSGGYVLAISARTSGAAVYNGCITFATSNNLKEWKIEPPILSPTIFDEMECPQIIYFDEHYYLFFSTPGNNSDPSMSPGLYCYWSKELFGPYVPTNGNGVVMANGEKVYDTRIVERIPDTNTFEALGWYNKDESGKLIGKLTLPFHITIQGDKVEVSGV